MKPVHTLVRLVRRYIPGIVEESCVLGSIARKSALASDRDTIVVAPSWASLHPAVRIGRGAKVCWVPLTPRIFRRGNRILYPGVDFLSLPALRLWLRYLGKKTAYVIANNMMTTAIVDGIGFDKAKIFSMRDVSETTSIFDEIISTDFAGTRPNRLYIRIVLTSFPKEGGLINEFLRYVAHVPAVHEIVCVRNPDAPELAEQIRAAYPTFSLVELSRDLGRRRTAIFTVIGEFLRVMTGSVFAPAYRQNAISIAQAPEDEDQIVSIDPDASLHQSLRNSVKDEVAQLTPKWLRDHTFLADNLILDRILQFRENVLKLAPFLPVDFVHSVDLISAPSGAALAAFHNARHLIDVNEFPLFEHRIGRDFTGLSETDRIRLYDLVRPAFKDASSVIAYSNGLARISRLKFGVPTTAVRNFHNFQHLNADKTIREDFNIPADAHLLVHVCTMAEQYRTEIALEAMTHLPPNYHLVFVGSFMNEDYRRKFLSLAEAYNLLDRVHFKGEVSPQPKYLSYISGADLGLAIASDEIPNVRFGLPNRFADLLAANLPIVSTYAVETAPIIRQKQLGLVLRKFDSEALATLIRQVFETEGALQTFQKNVDAFRKISSWENEAKTYFYHLTGTSPEAFPPNGDGKSIVFVFQRGLVRNRRTLRFARALREQGWTIKFLVGTVPSASIRGDFPESSFIRIPFSSSLSPAAVGMLAEQMNEPEKAREDMPYAGLDA
ncbi:MAG: glycosyltransferase family 4 protein [Rhodobiaceae bacterium]|nr:glycosyltransferase family 4 protein [Rhodobiaceae bacterium]